MKYFLAVIAAILLIGAGLVAGRQLNNRATDTTPPASSTTEPAASVFIYFTRSPASDDDPSKVFPVARAVPTDSEKINFALSELIKGPNTIEAGAGYKSDVILDMARESNCDGKDFTLRIEKKVARLQFCRQHEHTGTLADARAETQIAATLDQFDEIDKIVILNNQGNCEFDLSGENRCLK